MIDARAELADLIDEETHVDWFSGGPAHLADAILAAGYRKPRQVTTVEELDALPDGTLIFDTDPDALLKREGRWLSVRDDDRVPYASAMIALPATVLHVGGAE